MNFEQAKLNLTALASGLDPNSGLPLPEHSVYESPAVIRALYVALSALEHAQRSANRKRIARTPNAGSAWSQEDDTALLNQFDDGTSLAAIARSLGRSVASIQARLFRHGRIREGGFPARGGGGKMLAGRASNENREASTAENQPGATAG